ncbi:MAG TPA: EAL domain-containing protein [Xanthomonadaceae bacterium]|jgi:diguanylate cyclase (GGDEF)-like protein/PAS domain S-box-containing protein|nr:EAL domain-containing protein [Xanthomonadaceae bacterium]
MAAKAKETVIRLMVIEDQLDHAEHHISMLRNGGIAVRPQRPQDLAELKTQLSEGNVDLVLASLDATTLPFSSVIAAVNASGKDISVVATIGALEEDRVVAAMVAGARDVALRNRPEHLRLIVRNEFASLEDRRERRRAEAALHESERRSDSLMASSRDPIAYVADGMHIRANEAYLEMFGYEEFEEIEGLPLLDMVGDSDTERFKALLKSLAKGERPPDKYELRARRADGSDFDATMEFSQAKYEGEDCLQIVFRQRMVDEDMQRELDELRYRDQTTGLSNRRHFLEQLEPVVKAASEGRNDQILLLIEPDHYSTLMQEIGIGHTDEFLARLAARLRETIGDKAITARFGDHTFAVLKTDSPPQASLALAESIRAAFHGYIVEAGGRSVNLTVSIGGVQIGEKIASLQQVLGKAGQAVNSSGSLGGNRAEIFDPSARDRAETERIAAWVERIHEALKGDGFLLHYQPVISMNGQPGETYEALLRMKGPSGEIVPPTNFLMIAEEHGLLDDVDRWVVSRAIAVLAERKKAGKQTTLMVKVTPASLTEGGFETLITEQLKKHGVPGDRLILEIPESKVFTNLRATQELQKSIQALGCRIALEQFGTGLNSFQMLGHIDAAFLKIDRSFSTDLAKTPENQKKMREITMEGHRLGKQVIAEFVQDAGSMSVLFSVGVDYVEGHFLAQAGPDMNYEF